MARRSRQHTDLREACLVVALEIIDRAGLEKLSLREVARRLGVSHQAPYRHFPDRDHILAEIVARAFASFARHLDTQPDNPDPDVRLGAMGRAYLDYALTHPLQYRLMFGTPLPPGDHPAMLREARHAFNMLCEGLRRSATARAAQWTEDGIHADALFIWSGLHGLAGILSSSAAQTLDLSPTILEGSIDHVLRRFSDAMATRPPGTR